MAVASTSRPLCATKPLLTVTDEGPSEGRVRATVPPVARAPMEVKVVLSVAPAEFSVMALAPWFTARAPKAWLLTVALLPMRSSVPPERVRGAATEFARPMMLVAAAALVKSALRVPCAMVMPAVP